jgi:hypothetical protein
MGNFFGGTFFGGGFFGEISQEQGGGGGRKRPSLKKQKSKVIRWADFAHQEERAEALAKVLAETAIPIRIIDEDPFSDEDEAIIHALLLSRVLH